jgi:hypothetical protein
MKTIMYLLALLICGSSYTQTLNGIPVKELDVKYIEIVGTSKILKLYEVTISVNYGQIGTFKDAGKGLLLDKNGRSMSFNGMMDAVNFFSKYGYELVFAYPISVGNSSVYHYIMNKKAITKGNTYETSNKSVYSVETLNQNDVNSSTNVSTESNKLALLKGDTIFKATSESWVLNFDVDKLSEPTILNRQDFSSVPNALKIQYALSRALKKYSTLKQRNCTCTVIKQTNGTKTKFKYVITNCKDSKSRYLFNDNSAEVERTSEFDVK